MYYCIEQFTFNKIESEMFAILFEEVNKEMSPVLLERIINKLPYLEH